MASNEVDLTFIVDNCICEDPDGNPDLFYMELVSGTESEMNLPNPGDAMNINLKKTR